MIARMKDLHASGAWADTLPSQWGPAPSEIEIPLEGEPAGAPAAPAPAPARRLPLARWLAEGLRASVFRAPRTAGFAPSAWQVAVLAVLAMALQVGMERLEVVGPAVFSLRNWLASLWSGLFVLWFAWWAMGPAQRRGAGDGSVLTGGVAAWYVLSSWAPMVPLALLYGLLAVAARRGDSTAGLGESAAFWVLYTVLTLWMVAALVVVTARFVQSRARTAVFAAALVGVIAVGTWQLPDRPWEPAAAELAGAGDALGTAEGADTAAAGGAGADVPPLLDLSQPVFEAQQALLQRQAQALAPQREGVVDVYGLVFAPYAAENVFRRESSMVSNVLQERFDAKGRVLHLLNHAETSASHPWATPQNLQRALDALAARMDREHDLLVVYLTSHGARNHELAAWHMPLQVAPVTPAMLRTALDTAGIRNRVIAVSACYSGGWIEPLATDSTLIMTAADATHTSYGCGTLSELTFFGRAVFHEQLRKTHSFTQAFANAVPLIAQREVEAGKADGFSNPQIRVGAKIGPVLEALEWRLAAAEGGVESAPARGTQAQQGGAAADRVASSVPPSSLR